MMHTSCASNNRSSDRGVAASVSQEGIDDLDKAASFIVCAIVRRSA
jgi:hypothetical protein